MPRTLTLLAVPALLVASLGIAPTSQATPAAGTAVVPEAAVAVAMQLPNGSVRHQAGPYWVWFGPRNWIDSYGAYGITLQSSDGRLSLDYGFSSVVCATATSVRGSVNSFFANLRSTFRQTSGIRRLKVKSLSIRQLPVSAYGPLYFRQSYQWKGRVSGVKYRGEILQDYSLASGPTYCFSRNQSRVAPRKGFGASIRQLRSVQGALAYSGPGVPTGSQTDPDL